MSLFDEVDVEAKIAEIDGETEKVEVAAHERKARKKNSLVDTGLPEVVVRHDAEIPEGVEDYQIIGHDETRHLVLVPARMYVRIDLYPTVKYIGEDGEPVIVTAKRDESEMLKGTIASPELVSKVIHDKFVMHNPLYRQV